MIKNQENKKCGLIGEKLSHSFSPLIHSHLANYSYSLFELQKNELEDFIKSDKYDCANVTIPYKVEVMRYLDIISDEAQKIGCVNTVIHTSDGKLFGDNTDYYGFKYLVEKSKIDICDKNVLILGTGGSSKTISAVCRDMGAKNICFVSRSGEINYNNVYSLCHDTNIIVNTTPAGMYPKNDECHISLDRFHKLSGVIDIIFNPSKTKLLMQADALNIPYANGLPMLVAQAKRACEIFTGENIDNSEIDRIRKIIENNTLNIVLVGMPGCGKSHIGRLLAKKLGREFIDSDSEIVKNAKMSIPEIFAKFGEDTFREYENKAISDICKLSGKVIATGGGVVTKHFNYIPVKQNSKVVFISRDIDSLALDGRPLSHKDKLYDMYKVRLPLYEKFADFTVQNDSTVENCVDKIIDVLSNER